MSRPSRGSIFLRSSILGGMILFRLVIVPSIGRGGMVLLW